jgi:hypothetical protein
MALGPFFGYYNENDMRAIKKERGAHEAAAFYFSASRVTGNGRY